MDVVAEKEWEPSKDYRGNKMELRWHQTYDENGLDSEVYLQFRESHEDEWDYIPFVRERETDEDN